jgi:hypothetical protein
METRKDEILKRLKPFAQGAFSGHVSEWPQLKPLLSDVYAYILEDDNTTPEFESK